MGFFDNDIYNSSAKFSDFFSGKGKDKKKEKNPSDFFNYAGLSDDFYDLCNRARYGDSDAQIELEAMTGEDWEDLL